MSDDQTNPQMAVDVAVLKEQMRTLASSMSDMKEVNRQQSEKLDRVLTQLSEAKGGWRTMLWMGGAAATLAGILGAWIGLLTGRHP